MIHNQYLLLGGFRAFVAVVAGQAHARSTKAIGDRTAGEHHSLAEPTVNVLVQDLTAGITEDLLSHPNSAGLPSVAVAG